MKGQNKGASWGHSFLISLHRVILTVWTLLARWLWTNKFASFTTRDLMVPQNSVFPCSWLFILIGTFLFLPDMMTPYLFEELEWRTILLRHSPKVIYYLERRILRTRRRAVCWKIRCFITSIPLIFTRDLCWVIIDNFFFLQIFLWFFDKYFVNRHPSV